MKLNIGGWAVVGLIGLLAGCRSGTVTQKPAPEPPRIKAFTADNYQLTAGGTANLSWDTVNATKVQLLDENGATVTEGTSATGAAAVKPTKNAFYVLKAIGDGGADTRFVQIGVTEGLKSVFLIAVPPTVAPGGEVTLLYSALGGSGLKLSDSANIQVPITGDNGAVTVKPDGSTLYTLTATGPTGELTAKAKVTVTSAITSFVVDPRAAKPGAVMKLKWTTANAAKVTVGERTFGQLTSTTVAGEVASGSFDFTVPTDLVPDAGLLDDGGFLVGKPVPEGYPLQFTLTAESAAPVVVSTATVDAFAVDGPIINSFVAPKGVPAGQSFSIVWDVIAANIELLADGVSVFKSTAATGTAPVPAITASTTLTLIARDALGSEARATRTVAIAVTPTITSFTVPATIVNAGDPAAFSWVTTNAALIVISVKDGPTVYVNSTLAEVAAGTVQLSSGTSETFVLEAFNAAGQAARLEKPVAVTNPVSFTVTPTALGTDAGVPPSIAWDLTNQGPTDVFALPGAAPFSANDDAGFADISTSGTPISFPSSDDSQTEIALPEGFRFPFAGQTHSKLSVGTNGSLTFEPPDFVFNASTSRNNTDLTATTNRSPLIAPFWDDLDAVTTGRAQWKIEGTEFPRQLTVQWTNWKIFASSTTQLTFQAVLNEAGKVRFAYKQLSAGATGSATRVRGDSATVGVYSGGSGYAATTSVNTAALNEGDVREFFTGATAVGAYTPTAANRPLTAALIFKGPTGTVVPALARGQFAASSSATSVSIVEALPVPAAGVVNGQYVELYNAGATEVDLGGLQLVTPSAISAPFTFPPQTPIAAKGRLIVSASTDSATNGGVTSTLSWDPSLGQVSMAPVNDEVQLRTATGTVLSRLSWTTASGITPTAGNALQVDPATKRSAFAVLVCTTTTTFGSVPQTGTPGAANTACSGGYAAESIPAAYVDISTTGRALFVADQRDERVEFLAIPTPFPYFGANLSTLTVSTNGWVAGGVVGTPVASNRTTTATAATPLGAIAPFWDDLVPSLFGGAAANVYFERKADHTILQWHRYSTRNTTAVLADDLNFQVKLFDSGVIEFHYAGMSSPVPANADAVKGSSATVWLEKPAPATATDIRVVDVSIGKPTILPNSALRFTPAP